MSLAIKSRNMEQLITDWVAHHARTHPEKIATIDLASGRRHTYARMDDRVGRVAGALLKLGVRPGDRIGLIGLNSSDVLDIIFASWRIGAVHLALNFRLTAEELGFILADAQPSLMIADSAFSELVSALSADLPETRWIGTDGLGGPSDLEQLIDQSDPVVVEATRLPDDQAMLMYSSGTTGSPKGVILTHGNVLAAVINEAINLQLDRNMVSYAVMPLFHIGALMGFSLPAIFFGATAVIERVFDPGTMLKTLSDADLGVTHFLGVPAIYNAIAQHPQSADADFSRIIIAAGGAEPMPEPLLLTWYERGISIVEVYGMTEVCGLGCSLMKEDIPEKIGSAGKATLLTDIKIMKSPEEPAEPGEQGEVWMRGANVSPGYWQRPEANQEAFVDGWLRSGDVGRMDAQGYIYIEDRIKDMYISGGENVYPAEVESVLHQLAEISEVAVVGLPDPVWGETGYAVVVLGPGETLELATLQKHCAQHLATFKHPQRLIIRDELPRNATGKVLKFKLRESLLSGGEHG